MKPQIIIPHIQREVGAAGCDGGCDGDCACSLPDVSQKQVINIPGPNLAEPGAAYHIRGQVNSLPLSDDFSIVLAPQSQVGWALVNDSALTVLKFFHTTHTLYEWQDLSSISQTDFIEAAHLFYEAGFLTNDALFSTPETAPKYPVESWLFLTRACNMACAHCFVNKDFHEMTLEIGLQSIRKLFEIAKRHGHPGVKIKYAGGEPTLRWRLLTQLHDEAAFLSKTSGLPASEIIVTNGAALSPARLQYLKNSQIQLAISLDGFGNGHNRQRPFINGQPSFERVYKNILLALSMDVRPYLTMTLTRLNLDELPAITEFALKNHLFLNWNFYRPHTPGDPLVADFRELLTAMEKTLEVAQHYEPSYSFWDKLIDRSNFSAPHEHTCGAGRNYLSIDYDGSALPCHMLSGANQAGQALNTILDVTFNSFDNRPVDQKPGCKNCQWRYWCTGGCPLLSRDTGPIYCDVYKAVYPKVIELKALALLKSARPNVL